MAVHGSMTVGRRTRVAQVLLWLAAVAAAASAVTAFGGVASAGGSTKVVETWRAYGFVVFAGLFALLALRPRGYRGMWELVILNKVALTVTAVFYAAHGGIADTGTIIGWDGGLSVVLVVAYVLTVWSGSTRPAPRGDTEQSSGPGVQVGRPGVGRTA
ncbi:hypothetical protein [Rugosimonospora africana]|uniref:Uncharacterized protein n=1 Tax=Rugosimonospora africana TaxID=556532 RepID=A0A8J3VTM6_9ACTN|nr:hypothetical protein [Rugosimonospora africana]GIH18597.1 hypothetical protein Raf01_67690 [Rugosimonospora africana]